MNVNLYVAIEKPKDEEEIRRIRSAINLLMEIDAAIGKCNPDTQNMCNEFRDAANELDKILEGKWMY